LVDELLDLCMNGVLVVRGPGKVSMAESGFKCTEIVVGNPLRVHLYPGSGDDHGGHVVPETDTASFARWGQVSSFMESGNRKTLSIV